MEKARVARSRRFKLPPASSASSNELQRSSMQRVSEQYFTVDDKAVAPG